MADPVSIAAIATAGVVVAQAVSPAVIKAYRHIRELDIRDDIDQGLEQMDQLIDKIEDKGMFKDLRGVIIKWMSLVKEYRFDDYQIKKLNMCKAKIEDKLELFGEGKFVNGELVCTGDACHFYKAQKARAEKYEEKRNSFGRDSGRSKR
eukprot:CAMPEP_0194199772 /NCGR_PEP_ID=MMETSP0156-20130528/662_1 /TAXON_ID=33649 /ORGANISM="Thalassionema nitzschioides, Strain L26-B" /LENGTH=148 /DNA_ID=CAMNT_0038924709 /DNA_START=35 /DNA_END=481 /DNA_ORIENTATION=+